MKFTIHADGGARGNPGPAGSGAVVYDEKGETILEVSEYLGETTNNIAEYTAIIRALEKLAALLGERSREAELLVEMDSQLVIKQMRGEYKIKHPNMKPLAARVKLLIPEFKRVTFKHIPRELNADADSLANAAMDRGLLR